MVYTRQVDGNIKVECNRSLMGFDENSLITKINQGKVEEVATRAKDEGCNYVVFTNDVILDGEMEDYGFIKMAVNGMYTIYKLF